MDREEAPVWRPGVVTHVRERDAPRDETYGPTLKDRSNVDLKDKWRCLMGRTHLTVAASSALVRHVARRGGESAAVPLTQPAG